MIDDACTDSPDAGTDSANRRADRFTNTSCGLHSAGIPVLQVLKMRRFFMDRLIQLFQTR
jgi:hypothetical protein